MDFGQALCFPLGLLCRNDRRSKDSRVLSQIPEQALPMFADIARQLHRKTLATHGVSVGTTFPCAVSVAYSIGGAPCGDDVARRSALAVGGQFVLEQTQPGKQAAQHCKHKYTRADKPGEQRRAAPFATA